MFRFGVWNVVDDVILLFDWSDCCDARPSCRCPRISASTILPVALDIVAMLRQVALRFEFGPLLKVFRLHILSESRSRDTRASIPRRKVHHNVFRKLSYNIPEYFSSAFIGRIYIPSSLIGRAEVDTSSDQSLTSSSAQIFLFVVTDTIESSNLALHVRVLFPTLRTAFRSYKQGRRCLSSRWESYFAFLSRPLKFN
jgi:hypothetical protein